MAKALLERDDRAGDLPSIHPKCRHLRRTAQLDAVHDVFPTAPEHYDACFE